MERSIPWQSTAPGDAGPYSSGDFQDLFKYLFHALRPNMGPIIDSGTAPSVGLQVQATNPVSTDIDVLPGAALVEGVFYVSDATETFTIAANLSGNARIDTVVLRKDYTAQTVRLAVLTGTPAGSPVPPSLTQSDGVLWEIPLADIAVANGFVSISNSDITPRYEWANTADGVYLKDILNNSGITLQTGDVVIWDSTADRAVTITTVPDDPKTAGVWVGRTANGAYGRVLVRGVGFVKVGVAVTRGNRLGTKATATEAADFGNWGRLGIALESAGSAGLIRAAIDVRPQQHYILIRDEKTQNTAGGTFTQGAWQTRDLNTEVTDEGGYAELAANQITLAAGTYRVNIIVPAIQVGAHQARLQNTTDGTTVILGTSEYAGVASGLPVTHSIIRGQFTITAQKTFSVQHRCEATKATYGFGFASNFGTEIYTVAEFWREA